MFTCIGETLIRVQDTLVQIEAEIEKHRKQNKVTEPATVDIKKLREWQRMLADALGKTLRN